MLERPKRSQCPIALLSISESFWRSFWRSFGGLFWRVFLRVSKVELTLEKDSKVQSRRFRESKLWIAFQFESFKSWRQFEIRKSDKRLEGSAILKLRFSVLQKNFCSSAFVMLTLGRAYLTPPKFGSLSLESKLWTVNLMNSIHLFPSNARGAPFISKLNIFRVLFSEKVRTLQRLESSNLLQW